MDDITEAFRRLEEWRKAVPSRGYKIESPEWEDPVFIVTPTGIPQAEKRVVRNPKFLAAVDAALLAWEKDNG